MKNDVLELLVMNQLGKLDQIVSIWKLLNHIKDFANDFNDIFHENLTRCSTKF